MNSARPHILYILSDEHRGQALGHMGDPNVRTPVLDRLAAAGASFRRAYANCPVCTPSRGTIFSGRHAHCGPVRDFFGAFQPAAPSTATWLRQHGYHTAYIGKWHCGAVRDQRPPAVTAAPHDYPGSPLRTPEDRRGGFLDWAGFEVINAPFHTYVYRDHDREPTRLPGYQTDALTDEAIRYLAAYRRPEPLFLVLSVEPPHFPCVAPPEYRRFDPAQLRVGPNFARRHPLFADTYPQLDEQTLREILANYYAMVENLDANIGRLCHALAQLPAFANCLLVVISDHGEFAGNHGIGTCKIHHFEEAVRIPAIFRWPDHIPPQGSIPGLFGLVDLQATVCGLVGVPVPPWNQGRDWSPHLRGEPMNPPADLLLEMTGAPRWTPRYTDWRGLVTERWKYAYYDNGREFLHDLAADPAELHNLAETQPERTAPFRARLLELLRETREPYFDVIIQHGVRPPPARYLRDDALQIAHARRLGGLDSAPGPLPLA